MRCFRISGRFGNGFKKCNYEIITTDSGKYTGMNRNSGCWTRVFAAKSTTHCKSGYGYDKSSDNSDDNSGNGNDTDCEEKQMENKVSRLSKYLL